MITDLPASVSMADVGLPQLPYSIRPRTLRRCALHFSVERGMSALDEIALSILVIVGSWFLYQISERISI